MTRLDELRDNLAATEQRIAAACADAGRDRSEITLVAVTKTYPASDVELLAQLGVTDVGENRHPEAGDKAAAVEAAVRWHFLGGLQTNKAGAVARYADVVHSVDRAKLVAALSRGAEAAGRTLTCLVQVDFDATDPGRAGVVPDGVPDLAGAIANAPGLVLGGLMTVAPLGDDPAPHFDHLARLSASLREDHPDAGIISAGMSGDFEAAIRAGATHLRIGRSILGARPSTG
ncbi:YggS family pyridoxal phosphate-dependent enzyme [Aeromicrobium sp. SMF47]|uniref:YggS family pyridoxal phosphate-dependent enzyme n=1 Tax=Aeromicrobium TaxID=2040 RepID=UPI0013C0CCC0|nr:MULTISPECIES: YggS family pyridoxal phosphate-dependent enzyme [Aeromicrobium]MRJ77792.1 YggS family pyridoxal phosphate-dependent enzyme [Aeromicrobium yanjiei]MRK02161.1 YggS family pyridoxal phosphate-dependent enzyme [Aeromicrobium sp. S22]